MQVAEHASQIERWFDENLLQGDALRWLILLRLECTQSIIEKMFF